MNLDELRPILHAYRKQVQQAWSPATAHEEYEGKAGDPAGQCGVTSAWLQRRLLEDHGIETTYCVGLVEPLLPHHCWLAFDHIMVDLTADQAFDDAVVCEWSGSLQTRGIYYKARKRFTPEQLLADPVQERLAVLTEALS